jgi:uncharacterized membrane protein YfcA
VHVDLGVALAGLLVGFTVGLTGMGGGALMTPILVLLFKIQPLAAVSSDLVAAVIMKPVGGSVHARRGTVNWPLVRWLAIGSVPSAFLGVFVLKSLGNGEHVQSRLKVLLGAVLLAAAGSMVMKGVLQIRRERRQEADVEAGRPGGPGPFRLKPIPTFAIGVVGGLIVGMTSVGSGSLIIVALILLYPMLSMRQLVGTDLVQAIPLVASAALAHILFGDFVLSLTASVLLGSVPGVYLGARMSSRTHDAVIRPALVVVLVASALKLLSVSTTAIGLTVLAFVLVGVPAWGAIDALGRPEHHWRTAGLSKTKWLGWQAIGAPFGVGFAVALAYFQWARPKLRRSAAVWSVAVLGDEHLALG